MTEDETGRKPEEPSSGPPDRRDSIGGFSDGKILVLTPDDRKASSD
jgi:hypothetical protein